MEFFSGDLCGAGVEVEQHVAPAGERTEAKIDRLLLCLWKHKVPIRYDHPNSVGAFLPKLVEPDTFSLYTAGAVAPVRALSPSHILNVCVR